MALEHHNERTTAASVPSDDWPISLKNLLHELQCSKEAAARILAREDPKLVKEWRRRTKVMKEKTAGW